MAEITGAAAPATPVIPAAVFKITDFGAVGDGKTLNTEALDKAIAACSKAGGGRVVVPAGIYLTAPFRLVSHMALVLEKDAVIQATGKFGDSGLPDALPETQAGLDALKSSLKPLISGDDLTDVEISGQGRIDGADPWWARSEKAARTTKRPYIPRPYMVVINRCQRLRISGVTLSNSPKFHLVPRTCKDTVIENITITAPADAPNTDGIDPSNCDNMIIRGCTIDTGDDNIAFKAVHGDPTQNITVENCTFKHGHGLSIGSETNAGVHNILARHCSFEDTNTGIRIKSDRTRGGLVENISYSDMTMKNIVTAIGINLYYMDKQEAKNPKAQQVTATTPAVRNIRITNVTAVGTRTPGKSPVCPSRPLAVSSSKTSTFPP